MTRFDEVWVETIRQVYAQIAETEIIRITRADGTTIWVTTVILDILMPHNSSRSLTVCGIAENGEHAEEKYLQGADDYPDEVVPLIPALIKAGEDQRDPGTAPPQPAADAPERAGPLSPGGTSMPDTPRPDEPETGPKWAQVAELVRALIQDGTLRPGRPAPSGTALAGVTGYSVFTCRRALRTLVRSGTLVPGLSTGARPRVPAPSPAGQALTNAARALSSELAARRHTAGLTQPELAELLGYSVTAIGHAETGRLWQGRDFWECADKLLDAEGKLLTLHDAFDETAATVGDAASQAEPATITPAPHGTPPAPARPPAPSPPASSSHEPPEPEPLTDDERHAIQTAGRLYSFIAAHVVSDGPTRDDDLAEVRAAIHQIQHAIMAQAAARTYPREYRLLGTVITTQPRMNLTADQTN